MTVVETREPQDTLAQDEEVIAELSDGTTLIKTPEQGIVRPPEETGRDSYVFEQWKNATLFFGLWLETNGWRDKHPTSGARSIPVEVVSAGMDCVAAYMLVGTGIINSRQYVADELGVTEQTVSNYCNRVRFQYE